MRTDAVDSQHNIPIAITGATGFIGQRLLSHLDAKGYPSRVLVRAKRGRQTNLPNSAQKIDGGLSDVEALDQLLDGTKTCIHIAGATTAVDQSGFHAANVVATFALAARAHKAGAKKFVYISSQAARKPELSNYAASKAASEMALAAFQSKMQITIIRPPAVVGQADPMLGPVFDLVTSGWLPAPAESSSKPRKFAIIAVDDLVSEIARIATSSNQAAKLVEPCTVKATTWTEIRDTATKVIGRPVRLVRIGSTLFRMIGYIADGITKVIRRPLPLSSGKVRELLSKDWSFDTVVQDAGTLETAIKACVQDTTVDQSEQEKD